MYSLGVTPRVQLCVETARRSFARDPKRVESCPEPNLLPLTRSSVYVVSISYRVGFARVEAYSGARVETTVPPVDDYKEGLEPPDIL